MTLKISHQIGGNSTPGGISTPPDLATATYGYGFSHPKEWHGKVSTSARPAEKGNTRSNGHSRIRLIGGTYPKKKGRKIRPIYISPLTRKELPYYKPQIYGAKLCSPRFSLSKWKQTRDIAARARTYNERGLRRSC